jgi:hypothetical protein
LSQGERGKVVEALKANLAERECDVCHIDYERLDQLGNRISIDDRRRIETAIALKVPEL